MVGHDINCAGFVVNGPKHVKPPVQPIQKIPFNQQPDLAGSVSVCLTLRTVR